MRRSDRQVNDPQIINEIIEKADVLRIALYDGKEPYIVPLNFGYRVFNGKYIFYLHCANEGRKIDIIKVFPRVCFEIDIDHVLTSSKDACGWSMFYKSVIGYGNVEIITETSQKIKGLTILMDHYDKEKKSTPYDFSKFIDRTTILKLSAEEITCKVKSPLP